MKTGGNNVIMRARYLLLILASSALFAQDPNVPFDKGSVPPSGFPKFEIFVGGSYFRVHASGAEAPQVVGLGVQDFELEQHNLSFPLYGWHFGFTENANRWIGADVDLSGFYGAPKPHFLCSAATLENAQTCLTDFPGFCAGQDKAAYVPVWSALHLSSL
jgi:hypothetical protein